MNPPPLPASAPPKKCGLAIASLILGIAGIALCFGLLAVAGSIPENVGIELRFRFGPLAGLLAIACGHAAFSRIRKSAGVQSGQELAVSGIVTGYLSVVWVPAVVLVAFTFPNLFPPREADQRTACVANLRAIQTAKYTWALEMKKEDTDTPDESDLFGAINYIREKPVCPARGTYSLNPVAEEPTCTTPGHTL